MTALAFAADVGLAALALGSMPVVALWPDAGADPEEWSCPFCGESRPLLSLVQHMLTRGRCKARKLSMRVLSTTRRRW